MSPAEHGRSRRTGVQPSQLPPTVEHSNEGDFGEQNDNVRMHSPNYTIKEPPLNQPLNLEERTIYKNTGDLNATNIDTDFAMDGATVTSRAPSGRRSWDNHPLTE
ncbi:hypothetical protein VNI00_009763 [Paramarasmius palmivorus]|uniref:Uncharacterized protein n=1 Tax=Paramarasmius palmivorus TaxID=297713 RepID=A0AAW0CQU1_9AGAR